MARRLTASEFSAIGRAEDKFRFGVLSDARKNLSIKRSRTTASGRRVTAAINSTKTLSYSLKSKRKNLDIFFSMEYYGYWVDQGRAKGKFPPVSAIRKWIKEKPVRLRDESGRFVKQTPAKMNSLAYLIGRAIAKYGIKKTRFFSEPFETRWNKLGVDIQKAIVNDLDIFFK